MALFAGVAALAVIGTIAAAVFVLPIGTWREQDDDLGQREAQLDELVRVNGQLAAEVDRLKTDDGIREAAKEEIGFVEIGRGTHVDPAAAAAPDRPSGRLAVQRGHGDLRRHAQLGPRRS